MGECIMTSRGGATQKNPLDDIVVTSDTCGILVKVTTNGGRAIDDCYVCCNDGGTWYNYHTNEAGYAYFSTKSGQVNIVAWNNSVNGNWTIFDQTPNNSGTIDAPIGTKKQVNIPLVCITNKNHTITSNRLRFRVMEYDTINSIQIVGGGGGGWNKSHSEIKKYNYSFTYDYLDYSVYTSLWGYPGTGGGGGGYNRLQSFSVNHSQIYNITIGSAGAVNGTGGTTSAFDISATGGSYTGAGGGSGDYKGGNGGRISASTPDTFSASELLGTSAKLRNTFGNWTGTGWQGQIITNFEAAINLTNLSGNKSNYHSLLAYGGGGSACAKITGYAEMYGEDDSEETWDFHPSVVFINSCSNGGGKGGYWWSNGDEGSTAWTYHNTYKNASNYGCGGWAPNGKGTQGVCIINF